MTQQDSSSPAAGLVTDVGESPPSEQPWAEAPAPSKLETAGPARLCIEGELTIVRAADLRTELLSTLEREAELDLDLSQVREIDSAGVQLLLLAKRTAATRGKRLRLLDHSPAVLEVLQLFGLCAYFGDSQFIPSGNEAAP